MCVRGVGGGHEGKLILNECITETVFFLTVRVKHILIAQNKNLETVLWHYNDHSLTKPFAKNYGSTMTTTAWEESGKVK